MITAKEYDENFEVVLENERLWHKCRTCGAKFPQDVDLQKLSLEVLKHKLILVTFYREGFRC